MSDDTKSKTAARSAFELALAAVGLWYSVSCLMALAGNAPHASVVTRPVVLVMGWIGLWPTLVASLGLAAVGTWSFLVREDIPWVQHTLGAIGVGLGLALGLGAFRQGAGGELGQVLPSLVPGALGVSAGAGVGLAVLLATAWMAWLPGESGFSRKPGEDGALRAAGIPDEGDGVSREEARALIAELPPRPPAPTLPRTPSLRDDVRTRGGVPAGTRPLPGTDDRPAFTTPDQAFPGGEAPAGPGPGQRAGPHLAAPGAQPLRAGGLLGRQVRPEEPVVPRATPALSDAALPLADEAVPVQPSWERAGVAFPETEALAPAEETPEAGAAWESLDAPAEAAAWEAVEDELLAQEEDAGEEEDGDEELLSESEDERAPVLELDLELEADEEEGEEEEEEEEEPEEELDELPPEEDEEEPVAGPDQLGAEALEPELAEAPAPQDAAEAAPPEEPAPARKRERRKKRAAAISQSSLFDDGRPDTPADELAVVEIPAVAPVAPPGGAAPAARRSSGAAPKELLLEAGNLILDQNRVAVSMLQRRFGLDFDAATEVLDQLQALGLIGPYLGGKTRDILLSREEWMALAQGV